MLGHDYITKPEVTRPYLTYFFILSNIISSENHFNNEKIKNEKIEFLKKRIKDLNWEKIHVTPEILFHRIINEHHGFIRPIIRTRRH